MRHNVPEEFNNNFQKNVNNKIILIKKNNEKPTKNQKIIKKYEENYS